MPCPFKGPLEFTYSHGEAECKSPLSAAETCTQESRLLFRYQACANVLSSESVGKYSRCSRRFKVKKEITDIKIIRNCIVKVSDYFFLHSCKIRYLFKTETISKNVYIYRRNIYFSVIRDRLRSKSRYFSRYIGRHSGRTVTLINTTHRGENLGQSIELPPND